jgi:hypothetical protein
MVRNDLISIAHSRLSAQDHVAAPDSERRDVCGNIRIGSLELSLELILVAPSLQGLHLHDR